MLPVWELGRYPIVDSVGIWGLQQSASADKIERRGFAGEYRGDSLSMGNVSAIVKVGFDNNLRTLSNETQALKSGERDLPRTVQVE